MSETLEKKAERLFRLECIETLSWPPYGELSKEIQNQDPTAIPINIGQNLEDNVLLPLDASTSIAVDIDEEGNIRSFFEEDRSNLEFGSSAVSMSINRAPFKHAPTNSIRGSSSNVPFLPGYIDDLNEFLEEPGTQEDSDEIKFLDFDQELLNDVPVLGSIQFFAPKAKVVPNPEPEEVSIDDLDMFDLMNLVSVDVKNPVEAPILVENKDESIEKIEEKEKVEEVDPEVEECLISLKPKDEKSEEEDGDSDEEIAIIGKGGFSHARRIETNEEDAEEYRRLVPTMARQYPFELDPFQQSSVLCMERGESLFVAAHTSAGKTVVAEYAIAMCKTHRTRAIYTSPIKALSNQKFRDFKQIFDDVGLVTGDIQLHPEAFCIIMTTEILRSMLYNGSEVIRDLEWVVFDEVHYINNEERGHVWEEVLIMLPAHVKIVMLSATVPNCVEFADWVGRIKHRRINVISTDRRPVPLEHYLYTGQDGKTQKDLFKIIDKRGEFLIKGYNDAKEAKNKILEKNTPPPQQQQQNQRGGRGGGAGGFRGGGGGNRGGGGQNRGGGHSGGGGGGGNGQRNWPGKNDKNVYLNLINHMKAQDELPMVVFVFSRKRCDDNAQLLKSMDLTSEKEKSQVHKFFAQCIERLKGSDKQLPQVLTMKELCLRGFAVHHSGILPILKEVVELLFQQGYVKILFATETFAMGVNMPARCVVFDNIIKHDGTEKRVLNPGEYTQMAGRAGRRGLDSTGTVIVLCKDTVHSPDVLKQLMSGSALELKSKFRVTYSMLLNLLRVEQLRIEDMLQRSYVESSSLRESVDRRKKLKDINKQLDGMTSIDCSICDASLREYHDALYKFVRHRQDVWPKLNRENAVNKLLISGRYLIVNNAQHELENDVVVLLKEMVNGQKRSLQIMVAVKSLDEAIQKDQKAEKCLKSLTEQENLWNSEESAILATAKYGTCGSRRVNDENLWNYRICEVPVSSIVAVLKKQAKQVASSEIVQDYQRNMIPRFRSEEVPTNTLKVLQQLSQVKTAIQNEEVEIYTFAELAQSCSNIDLNFDVSFLATNENELNDRNLFAARHCSSFEEHLVALRQRIRVERAAQKLKFDLSSDALLLSEEYQNRLAVLQNLGFVEDNKMVSLKGRIACEIHHQELLITELILDYKFHSRPPAELAALLSTLTCQYNSGKERMKFEDGSVFNEIRESVTGVMTRLESVASRHNAQIADVGCEIRFDLMEVVYHWASGMPFAHIMEMTDAQEGLIVKCIQRLDEVCKDVRNAGRIVGDPALVEKMEEVSASIRRDIVFAASLYTSV